MDISTDSAHGHFMHPNSLLSDLVRDLPHLASLDISGTNLAGNGSFFADAADHDEAGEGRGEGLDLSKPCDIPGLGSRVNRPLDFLGLYKTTHEACLRGRIPAEKVKSNISVRKLCFVPLQPFALS